MATLFAIETMTTEEKLQTMEALWQELCRDEKTIAVYDWHRQVLDDREALLNAGKAQFIDWEQAKQDISRETS